MCAEKNTVTIKENRKRFVFNKGEYYRLHKSEGGVSIENNEEWFDIYNPEYMDILNRGFCDIE
jgi:hypothetical protein